MPNGMYLDGLELGPKRLGKEMHKIISNTKSYYDMFKWHKHYSFHNPLHSSETNGVCELCAILNNDHERHKITVYKNIVKWFNDRKDWDVWNTRRIKVPELFFDRPKTRKATRKHSVKKYITSSDSDHNMSENDKSDSEDNMGENDIINNDGDTVHKQISYEDSTTTKKDNSDRDTIIALLDEEEDDASHSGEIISIDENNLNINDFVTVSKHLIRDDSILRRIIEGNIKGKSGWG